MTGLYGASCARYGVLSVCLGVTVWTNGRVLWWREAGGGTTWPAADYQGAARRLADAVRVEDVRAPQQENAGAEPGDVR